MAASEPEKARLAIIQGILAVMQNVGDRYKIDPEDMIPVALAYLLRLAREFGPTTHQGLITALTVTSDADDEEAVKAAMLNLGPVVDWMREAQAILEAQAEAAETEGRH